MTVDGQKLRNLRQNKGMSQEKLGLLSNLNKRTIQRAENGAPVALESIAFIADALEVKPEDLRGRQLELFEGAGSDIKARSGEVILVPVTRGSRLVNTLRSAFMAEFAYEVEATKDTLTLMERIIAVFHGAWKNPWEPPTDWRYPEEPSDAAMLRLQAEANEVIPSLADNGMRVFMGTYSSYQQTPYYNVDEGLMLVSRNQPKNLVTMALIIVSDSSAGHLSRFPADHEDAEEIPF
ncbi:MAG: helix-turn-helix transcriptional regulator [Pseudomonadota bacterium]